MIQANELRLGLFFNVPRQDQSPFRIDEIDFLHSTNAKVGMNVYKFHPPGEPDKLMWGHPLTWELKDISGIELTEEILLKCGFEDCNSYKDYRLYLPPHKEAYIELSIRKDGVRGFGITDDPMELDLKYLHQLQNVFHALTGKELEINFNNNLEL